jgi:hypothetical protein
MIDCMLERDVLWGLDRMERWSWRSHVALRISLQQMLNIQYIARRGNS